ncbi:site-specific DNA-methyltransferase [Tardiphaga alba]|uniref:Methyltransferase n=1 Tax=Tardiphaga alba TaxID=340268 RepID=A0ABX8AD79_9BRAD|nr:DNA methyltransferase [Tardiphaga alba]QUS40594.1 site-specific DNA-methyltransferase [Tardiphaga alba]
MTGSRAPATSAFGRVEHLAEGVSLYLGDCREILPTLGQFDAVVTDPPYGIGASSGTGKYGREKWQHTDLRWDDHAIDGELVRLLLAAGDEAIIWGGNYFLLPPSRGFLVWDKGAGFKGRDFAECEQAWFSKDTNARVLTRDPLARGDYKGKQHPTEKPVAVMEWSLQQIPMAKRIVDPLMGSGSTGVAAVKLSRSFTGIEIEERYFDIACRRIQAALDAPDLFVQGPPPAKQEAML